MRILMLIFILCVPASASVGSILRNAFDLAGAAQHRSLVLSPQIARVVAPYHVVLRSAADVRILAPIETRQFTPRIRLEGNNNREQDDALIEAFLHTLARDLRLIQHLEIHNLIFERQQSRRLITLLNLNRHLRTLSIIDSYITGNEIEQLTLNSLEELTYRPCYLGNHILIDPQRLFSGLPHLRTMILPLNILLTSAIDFLRLPPGLTYLDAPWFAPTGPERLHVHNLLHASYWLIHINNVPLNIQLEILQRIQILLEQGQSNPVIAASIPMMFIHPECYNFLQIAGAYNQESLIQQMDRVLRLLIGDGTHPLLHRPNGDGWTLAMFINNRTRSVNPVLADAWLQILSGPNRSTE